MEQYLHLKLQWKVLIAHENTVMWQLSRQKLSRQIKVWADQSKISIAYMLKKKQASAVIRTPELRFKVDGITPTFLCFNNKASNKSK